MLKNPVPPHNLMECCDALFNLTVYIRQNAKNREQVDKFVRYAGKLEDVVLAYGQEVYQQRDLNQFYRQLGLDGLDKFVDNVENSMANTRKQLRSLMEWANRLCEAYVNQRPFEQYMKDDDTIDENCRYAYIWVTSQADMRCGYDVKDLMFTKRYASKTPNKTA